MKLIKKIYMLDFEAAYFKRHFATILACYFFVSL